MKYRLLVAAVTMLLGIAGMVALLRGAGEAGTLERPVEISAEPEQFQYQMMDGSKLKDFNLSFSLKLGESSDRARALVNAADSGNAYYLDLSCTEVTFGSFESGVARALCRKTGVDLSPGTVHEVLVKRRTPDLTLVIDGERLATVQDETHAYGGVGFALESQTGLIDNVKVQPVVDVYFADSFMRGSAERSAWTPLRGKWEVNVVSSPTMSANAFDYRVQSGEEGSSVTGETFWDDYALRVSARSVNGSAMGLYLYYRDENNYYRFVWERRDGKEPTEAKKRLEKMRDGRMEVLAESSGGFIENQWYELEMEANGNSLRAYIDGHQVFAVRDRNLAGGMVGLYARNTEDTRFDDVFVRTLKTYRDDLNVFPGGSWTVLGGEWQALPAGSVTVVSKSGQARAVTGSRDWGDYVVNTEIEPGDAGRCGLNLCYGDERSYYAVVCVRGEQGDTWELARRDGEQESVLARKETDEKGVRYAVSASVNRGRISLNVNGNLTVETFDRTLSRGCVGWFAQGTSETRFTGLEVAFPREATPLVAEQEVFESEATMKEWSRLAGQWTVTEVKGRKFNWHRGTFPGTSTLEVKLDRFDKPTSEAALLVNSDGGPTDGYRAWLGTGTEPSVTRSWEVALFRGDTEVARRELPTQTHPASITAERMGNLLVVSVNGESLIHFQDPQPLTGDRMGWSVVDCRVNADEVKVSSPNVYEYTFNRSPVEWRTMGGVWEITNRWECDPRWSFFSGKSEAKAPAVLWSKRLFEGDTTVEFFVGPKMDRKRGGSYDYVGDFNCTLNADGRDLTSGYSFLLGGFDDTKSVIYRKTEVVGKESKVTIPRGEDIHRKWFRVRVQNKGGRLGLWLNGNLVTEYTDPEPLTGNRFAVWTYDNGIMVARLTVSCEDGRRLEDPDIVLPERCRSVYDFVPTPVK